MKTAPYYSLRPYLKKLNPEPCICLIASAHSKLDSQALSLAPGSSSLRPGYLEGNGDLVHRLVIGITRVTIWVIGIINILTKSP